MNRMLPKMTINHVFLKWSTNMRPRSFSDKYGIRRSMIFPQFFSYQNLFMKIDFQNQNKIKIFRSFDRTESYCTAMKLNCQWNRKCHNGMSAFHAEITVESMCCMQIRDLIRFLNFIRLSLSQMLFKFKVMTCKVAENAV